MGPLPADLVRSSFAGALTVVRRQRDPQAARDVAVKTARPGAGHLEPVRRMLRREAEARALDHPNVLPLYRLEEDAGCPVLVGPWLPGGSLTDLPPEPLAPTAALEVVEGVAAGIDALHRAGWRHGDLSPSNVLLADRRWHGAHWRAVLCDLASAQRLGERPVEGGVALTPSVAAPELWDGAPATGLSDVYGLGALAFRCLTGAMPFQSDDVQTLRELHATAPVPAAPLRAIGPQTEAAVTAALTKDPRRRPADGATFAAALRRALADDGMRVSDTPVAAAAHAQPILDVAAAGERIERFAATLEPGERRALRFLLEASARLPAGGIMTAARIGLETFAPASALLAFECCGLADALAREPLTSDEAAMRCGLEPRPVRLLLLLLVARGDLIHRDGRFELPPDLAALYVRGQVLTSPARPLADAHAFWAAIRSWLADGEPVVDGGGYEQSVDSLDAAFARPAARLADRLVRERLVPAGARILDVGAGSGVWSFAVARAAEDVTVTALDRDLVLARTRQFAATAGLPGRVEFIAGDWRDTQLPAGAFDLAFLANVCHVEAAPHAAELVQRAATAVRTGGVVAVVDTMPERLADEAAPILQAIQLGLRTPGGTIHPACDYRAWLDAAGLLPPLEVALDGGLVALVSRRAEPRDA